MGNVEFVCAKREASPALAFVMVNRQMGERNTSASNGIGKPRGGSQHHRRDPWTVGIAGNPSQCLQAICGSSSIVHQPGQLKALPNQLYRMRRSP